MNTRTDRDITADVRNELAWDPAVSIDGLDVLTTNGHVTLSGTTDTYGGKDAAEDAACRVRGVRGVTNDITVTTAPYGGRSDTEIQADIRTALALDTFVPLHRIDVGVDRGVVTLSGTLDYNYRREAAEDDAGQIGGVKGVVDLITVAPAVATATSIAHSIAEAFARNAELADDNVSVRMDGSTAVLDGTVRTWSEFHEAEDTAWRARGVRDVVNNILVTS